MDDPIFVINMASAAVGITVGSHAYDLLETIGQGDTTSVMLSVGRAIYRRTGDKFAAERGMYCLAVVSVLIVMASKYHTSATDDAMADLICYFAERLKSAGRAR